MLGLGEPLRWTCELAVGLLIVNLLCRHFFVEGNRPATFKVSLFADVMQREERRADRFVGGQYPVFSLRGDFRMLWEVLSMQRSL